ncbi:MOSC domain-containing protein [Haloglomus litoreum]|uniref:MOSC domain-containing protein n=1 Tax=Haloglomus litoreum TaxID=3034026 RepID=UPI0023E80FFB|nr:MOSC N-terminal beta barrel domain-containing protein [Haloglomus sp. DT116]
MADHDGTDPRVARLRVYPVKSLDPYEPDRAEVLPEGGLGFDREFALVDDDGDYVNGKNERAVHRLRSTFEPPATVRLRPNGDPDAVRTFDLADSEGRAAAEAWLAEFFGYPVHVRRDEHGGFPDDTHAHGPTVVSTATVERVADWFDLPVENARRRLRANIEVDGVPAFWEDRLFPSDDREHVVGFRVGDAEFEGINPCQRCVVPSRDPDTGEELPEFNRRFVERRAAEKPDWAGDAWFDHEFRLMVNTRVPRDTVGAEVSVGDAVRILDERPR